MRFKWDRFWNSPWPGLLIVLAAILVLIAANSRRADPASSETGKPDVRLYTINHDHHKFIVAVSVDKPSGVALMHHPDCPVIH